MDQNPETNITDGADSTKDTSESLDTALSSQPSRDAKTRNGLSPKRHRRKRSMSRRAISSTYLQPGMALTLFTDPPSQMLWDECPLWSPEKMFLDGDEISKTLLSDMRSSLKTSKSAILSSSSLPSTSSLDKCYSMLPKTTVQKISFGNDAEKMLGGRKVVSNKMPTKITVLKRTTDSQPTVHTSNSELSGEQLDREALSKLDRFFKDEDMEFFDEALSLCTKAVRTNYYLVLELINQSGDTDLDIKTNLLIKFANALESAYLKTSRQGVDDRHNAQVTDQPSMDPNSECDNDVNDPTPSEFSACNATSNESELIKRFSALNIPARRQMSIRPKSPDPTNPFLDAYKKLLLEARRHHTAFVTRLREILKGFDPNLVLKRDLSPNYVHLFHIKNLKGIPKDNANKFSAVKPFLYREYMSMGVLERIAMKSFKLDPRAVAEPSDRYLLGAQLLMPNICFVNAAILEHSKVSPFEGLISVCNNQTYLSRFLYALCVYIRDQSNSRPLSVDLTNLSKLYIRFFGTFVMIYDCVIFQSYRLGCPHRSMKEHQRWILPDGVKDPLYDKDPARRICNHLHRFVEPEDLELFKYYHYWSGIRLLTFMGYKIINHLDLDQFDENVQVAIYGLSIGFSSGVADNVHLLQLARFLIAIVTICEQQHESDADRRGYRTACRLLVEYFALLLQYFNKLFSDHTLFEIVKNRQFSDEMTKFLIPITLLFFWMANSPMFFKYETWNRRWTFSVSFLADLWPQMSVLGNSIRLLKNNGLFRNISVSTELDTSAEALPEIVNSFGISPIFNGFPIRYSIDTDKATNLAPDIIIRLFSTWESLQSIANRGEYFVYQEKKGFAGHSDEARVLVNEPEYYETPRLLPVPLNEIEEIIQNRKTFKKEEEKELEQLIEMAKAEAKNEKSILHDKVLVIVKPRYLVIDTNQFLDDLDTILKIAEDPSFTILVPLPVITELKGLRNKSVSPTHQDENYVRQVAQEAVRSLQILESTKRDNIKLLLRKGNVADMDIHRFTETPTSDVNNDRLIIETAKEFNDKVCSRSIRIPRGDIWIFRDVLLVTRDRVMMLLANAYRLPSLDISTFARWSGFTNR